MFGTASIVPCAGAHPHQVLTVYYAVEHTVRFELTVLGICSPLHWATLPRVHVVWYTVRDSNSCSRRERAVS